MSAAPAATASCSPISGVHSTLKFEEKAAEICQESNTTAAGDRREFVTFYPSARPLTCTNVLNALAQLLLNRNRNQHFGELP
ncbi:hypothetical protein CKO09_00590 [Chromatium weissei]|nr:hypothetical protein [Chromatium weissei]